MIDAYSSVIFMNPLKDREEVANVALCVLGEVMNMVTNFFLVVSLLVVNDNTIVICHYMTFNALEVSKERRARDEMTEKPGIAYEKGLLYMEKNSTW